MGAMQSYKMVGGPVDGRECRFPYPPKQLVQVRIEHDLEPVGEMRPAGSGPVKSITFQVATYRAVKTYSAAEGTRYHYEHVSTSKPPPV